MSTAQHTASSNDQAAAAHSRPSLIDRARGLAPSLRRQSDESNRLRRLADSSWNDLMEAGIFRVVQPARWGGGELHPREAFSAIIEVARADGCAGWVAGIVGIHPWQTALYSKETQQEVWGEDPTTMNSSSYAPTGKAERVSGGYRISGRWSFSSGCDHCRWVNLGAIAGGIEIEGRQLPDFRSFLLPRKDYRIDDNWHVAGLAGTGSKDIVVNNAFVPAHRSMSHWDFTFNRPMPGWEINPAPLYRMPFAIVFINALSAAILGTAAGFLDDWIGNSRDRVSGFGAKIIEDSLTQELVAQSSYAIKSATLTFLDDCDAMFDAAAAGVHLSLERRAELRYNTTRSAELAVRAVDKLFDRGGGRAVFLDHPLQRRFQDIKAMSHHTAMNPDLPARLYGAAQLGLPVLDMFL